MASKMENQITGTGDKCSNADKDSVKTVETQQMLDITDEPGFVPDNNIDEELKEQYDAVFESLKEQIESVKNPSEMEMRTTF